MVDERLKRFSRLASRLLAVDRKGELGRDFCSRIKLHNRLGTAHALFSLISSPVFRDSIVDSDVAVETSWYSLADDHRLSCDWLPPFLFLLRLCLSWKPHLLYIMPRIETAQTNINNRLESVMTGGGTISISFVRRSTATISSFGTVNIKKSKKEASWVYSVKLQQILFRYNFYFRRKINLPEVMLVTNPATHLESEVVTVVRFVLNSINSWDELVDRIPVSDERTGGSPSISAIKGE